MLGNILVYLSRVSTYTKDIVRKTFNVLLVCVFSRKVRLKIFTVRLPTISRDSASVLEFLQATRAILIVSVNLVTRRTSGHAAFVFRIYVLFGEFYLANLSNLRKDVNIINTYRSSFSNGDNEIKELTYNIYDKVMF